MPEEYPYHDSDFGFASHYILPVLLKFLGHLPEKAVIADLGCGNGSLLAQLRRPGWELHGLEVSASGVEHARKAYPDIHFDRVDLMSDLSSHSLAGACDAVISTEVVEHVYLPRTFARNCHAFLKPGGTLVLSTPYHGYVKNLVLAATGRMDAHFTALWDYGHIKFWSRKTLSALLAETGFDVAEFRGAGRVPYLWKSMVVMANKK